MYKSEFKTYPSGVGLKVSIKCGNRNLHAALFQGSAVYDIMKKFDVGDEVVFKAILLNSNRENDLGRIFHVRNFK